MISAGLALFQQGRVRISGAAYRKRTDRIIFGIPRSRLSLIQERGVPRGGIAKVRQPMNQELVGAEQG